MIAAPDESSFSLALSAWFHTGDNAVDRAYRVPPAAIVAADTETPSVTDSFTIKCLTAAWVDGTETHAVLLDPARNPDHHAAAVALLSRAGTLAFHNAPFDVPGMVHLGILGLADLDRVVDALVYARMAWPDQTVPKKLEALAERLLGMSDRKDALKQAVKASGLGTMQRWFADGDIHIPLYRVGALSDTVVTLRVLPPVWEAAVTQQLTHRFGDWGATTREQAAAMVEIPQRVNRVTLRRAARGLRIDLDYLHRYREQVADEKRAAEKQLRDAGCRPGQGIDVVTLIERDGKLPARWPRTPTGRLKADKKAMERLDHPLAVWHHTVAHTDKILGYLEKCEDRARFTGLIHPQFQVLGASTTGRMSTAEPELQQFPEEARPIVLADADAGMWSVDWSQIEPRLLAWGARDDAFILPSEQGADLYEPINALCRTDRKTSKVVLLATMYGQQRAKLAASLEISDDRAGFILRQLSEAMPQSTRFMAQLRAMSEQHGKMITMGGRILPIPPQWDGKPAAYKGVNYFAQGSNADLVYHVVLEMERRGIGDAIYLLMHDEVVCTAEVAAEVAEIMRTPPEWLCRWAGRVPVIHTDAHDLEGVWTVC